MIVKTGLEQGIGNGGLTDLFMFLYETFTFSRTNKKLQQTDT